LDPAVLVFLIILLAVILGFFSEEFFKRTSISCAQKSEI